MVRSNTTALHKTAFQIAFPDSPPAHYIVAGNVTDLVFKLLLIVSADVIFSGEKNTKTITSKFLPIWC